MPWGLPVNKAIAMVKMRWSTGFVSVVTFQFDLLVVLVVFEKATTYLGGYR